MQLNNVGPTFIQSHLIVKGQYAWQDIFKDKTLIKDTAIVSLYSYHNANSMKVCYV